MSSKKIFSAGQAAAAASGLCKLVGKERSFSHFRSLAEADSDSLVFISADNLNSSELVRSTKARLIIASQSAFQEDLLEEKTFLISENPKLAFIRIVKSLLDRNVASGVHSTAIIHPQAKIDSSASIGPFTFIGKAIIGANTKIDGSCYIYDDVKIGRNCQIAAGCVFGAEGFGHVQNQDNKWENFPHLGGVQIEDEVEFGVNASVARGSLSDTIIGEGAKIDALTQIGHNVVIGPRAIILSQSVIGGSSKIGKGAFISLGTKIADYINIGEGAFLGIGSVIVSDVAPNSRVASKPSLTLPALDPSKSQKEKA